LSSARTFCSSSNDDHPVGRTVSDKKLLFKPFLRLTYHEAVRRFGKDSPDLRFGMEWRHRRLVAHGDFSVFRNAVEAGGQVKGYGRRAGRLQPQELDELAEFVKAMEPRVGLAGCAAGRYRSSFAKYLSGETVDAIVAAWEGSRATCFCSSPTGRRS